MLKVQNIGGIKLKINSRDIEIINLKTTRKVESVEDFNALSKVEIMKMIEELSIFIGYDSLKKDIDENGKIIDRIISKLLLLEKSNDGGINLCEYSFSNYFPRFWQKDKDYSHIEFKNGRFSDNKCCCCFSSKRICICEGAEPDFWE